MNYLLIGGCGFIGFNLIEKLKRDSNEIHVLSRSKNKIIPNDVFEKINSLNFSDINDSESIINLISKLKIDVVIHMASNMIPSSSFFDFEKEMNNNIIPSFRIITELSKRNIKLVYLSSGGAVYGEKKSNKIGEYSNLEPISYYGYSKEIFENFIRLNSRKFGLNYLIVRPSNPFGRYQNPKNSQGIIAVLTKRILNDETIEIWGDGLVVRDYIPIEKFSEALTNILCDEKMWNKSLNISSGVGISVLRIIEIIENTLKTKAKVVFKPSRDFDIKKVVLKNDLIKKHFSISEGELVDSIVEYVRYLKINDIK